MPDLPSGTVTFLFTDIEGSTALWERDRAAMAAAVERHLALLRDGHRGPWRRAVQDRRRRGPGRLSHRSRCHRCRRRGAAGLAGGAVARPAGTPAGAHGAACRGSRPDATGITSPLRSTGWPACSRPGTARQILLTEVVERLVAGALPAGVSLRPLGTHRLRDLHEPEEVFQVVAPGLPDQFPPLQSLPRHPTNLAIPPTALIGRDEEVAAILRLLETRARGW